MTIETEIEKLKKMGLNDKQVSILLGHWFKSGMVALGHSPKAADAVLDLIEKHKGQWNKLLKLDRS